MVTPSASNQVASSMNTGSNQHAVVKSMSSGSMTAMGAATNSTTPSYSTEGLIGLGGERREVLTVNVNQVWPLNFLCFFFVKNH